MPLPSWLRPLAARLTPARRGQPKRTPRRVPFRPRLEGLEDRAVPSAYLVTTTADSGPGSLRDALTQVNADTNHALYASPGNPGVDEIDFGISAASDTGGGFNAGTGVATITPLSGLPAVTNAVLINGYTQAGASQNTLLGPSALGSTDSTLHPEKYGDNAVLKVELDGANAGTATGLQLAGNNITVQGLVINRFAALGISVTGTGDVVRGNFLGTDVSGTTAFDGAGQPLGNGGADVYIQGSLTTIGGPTPAERNLISGAQTSSQVHLPPAQQAPGTGIYIAFGDRVAVQGDFIGTDVTGTAVVDGAGRPLGNAVFGIYSALGDVLVGGSVPGAGNVISGNGDGVRVQNGGVTLQGNFIGTDVTGTKGLGNASEGVFGLNTGSSTQTYGGPGSGNLISANGRGIRVQAGSNYVVQGNFIGTDVTGTRDLLNGNEAILTYAGSSNLIGGTDPGDRNVISGYTGAAIRESGDTVEGNYFGTDITGTRAIPSGNGVVLGVGATNNTVGGTTAAARNIICSGPYSDGYGVSIGPGGNTGSLPSNNVVEGNFIGTDVTGSVPLGNRIGVLVAGVNNLIGGTAAGAGNTIANGTDGVFVGDRSGPDPSTQYNSILGNSIYGNSDVGIRFQTGANNLLVNGTLTAYSASGATIVTGTLTSTPSTTFRVEFFANTANDPEGRTFLGSAPVTTDASGHANCAAFLSALPAGQGLVTETVTDPNGNTGGFSPGVTAVPLPPSSLSGMVWEDFNHDGQVDFGEKGIGGVTVTLTGTDFLGNAVNLSGQTDNDGAYVFLNLLPGTYAITETQPAGYGQGTDAVGTAGGSLSGTDQFSVPLGVGVNGLNYNFGERPTATGPVQKGQVAGIGFWNNKSGQALIKAFNGGTGTQLADWLAATMPNTFGVHAGANNLTGKSNAAVAALFQQDFVMKGVKLDAQVLATALSVYATNATLDSTKVAAQYGFTVGGDGLGAATVNVGASGDAFGVANNTTMTVMDLLLATDAQAVNGVLYGGNTTKRNEANDIFSAINQAGGL
jgi:hypothetical protein